MKLGEILQRLLREDGKSAAIQIELNGFEIFRTIPPGGTVIGAIAVSGPGDKYEHELIIAVSPLYWLAPLP